VSELDTEALAELWPLGGPDRHPDRPCQPRRLHRRAVRRLGTLAPRPPPVPLRLCGLDASPPQRHAGAPTPATCTPRSRVALLRRRPGLSGRAPGGGLIRPIITDADDTSRRAERSFWPLTLPINLWPGGPRPAVVGRRRVLPLCGRRRRLHPSPHWRSICQYESAASYLLPPYRATDRAPPTLEA